MSWEIWDVILQTGFFLSLFAIAAILEKFFPTKR